MNISISPIYMGQTQGCITQKVAKTGTYIASSIKNDKFVEKC